jgi:hypothetical protein
MRQDDLQRSKRRNAVLELLLNEANRNRHGSPIGDGVKLRLHVLGIEAVRVTEHHDDVAGWRYSSDSMDFDVGGWRLG